MTFRKCSNTCLFFRSIRRIVRHLRWSQVKPASKVIEHYGHVMVHYSSGRY